MAASLQAIGQGIVPDYIEWFLIVLVAVSVMGVDRNGYWPYFLNSQYNCFINSLIDCKIDQKASSFSKLWLRVWRKSKLKKELFFKTFSSLMPCYFTLISFALKTDFTKLNK